MFLSVDAIKESEKSSIGSEREKFLVRNVPVNYTLRMAPPSPPERLCRRFFGPDYKAVRRKR
jgi:hypothetical protein